MGFSLQQQIHGYRGGHSLLDSSHRLDRTDQEVIDRLSDMAGPVRPGEHFAPYLTLYPLPSRDYYVVARTVQDLEAPRAGCVRTRSLLVPMAVWQSIASPAAIADMVDRLSGPAITIVADETEKGKALPPATGGGLTDLVEALFLETRSPVVVFEQPDARAVALRLVNAAWPALRSSLSICTFALAPRHLDKRPFDLLFAPKTSRTRFSDWPGRRVDGSVSSSDGRHRWTSLIERRIFVDEDPSLIDRDAFLLLGAGEDPDTSVVRLSLLWDELRQKSLTQPTAVLGLIDIAATRQAASSSWSLLEPDMVRAVSIAAETMSVDAAWDFLMALTSKLGGRATSETLPAEMRDAVALLAQRDPVVTLESLVADPIGQVRLLVGDRSIVDALVRPLEAIPAEGLAKLLLPLPVSLLVPLCQRSEACLDAILASDALADQLIDEIDAEGALAMALARRSQPRHATWLKRLLAKLDDRHRLEAVRALWQRDENHVDVMLEAVTADLPEHLRPQMRAALAEASDDVYTDGAIAGLIRVDQTDARWLIEATSLGKRRASILDRLIRSASAGDLRAAFAAPDDVDRAVSIAEGVLPHDILAQLLLVPSIASERLIAVGTAIYPALKGRVRAALAQAMASRVVADELFWHGGTIERVLALTASEQDVSALIATGLSCAASGNHVSRIIIAFDSVDPLVRRRFVEKLDDIVSILMRRSRYDISAHASQALANLLTSGAGSPRQHIARCAKVLPVAMAAVDQPASPLVIVTFPVVYMALKQDIDLFDIVRVFVFVDWDKCKVARKNLVRAFLRSKWPPIDLVRTAARTEDVDRIAKRLAKETGGGRFLARLQTPGIKLITAERHALQKFQAIAKAGAEVSIRDWDT